MPKSLWQENLEAIILATIMVLLVRFFCLEPFKIPTSSMEPTLIGDPICGDQVIVNKFHYYFLDPQRWDILVFKYPLNSSRNFIKRLIGLPGEKIFIHNGNIYVNDKIARKPWEVQQRLLYPLFIGKNHHAQFAQFWQYQNGEWLQKTDKLYVQAASAAWCKYKKPITNLYSPISDKLFFKRKFPYRRAGGNVAVGEFLFRCRATLQSQESSFLIQFRSGSQRFRIAIYAQGQTSPRSSRLSYYFGETNIPQSTFPIDFYCAPGTEHLLMLSNIDRQIDISVDKQSIFTLDCTTLSSKLPSKIYESAVKFGGKGKLKFVNISLWRDIHYLGRQDIFGTNSTWQVPAHHYFVLGDNSPKSNDSRDWKLFQLILQNGVVEEGDQNKSLRNRDNVYYFEDIYGRSLAIPEAQTRDMLSNIYSPFVPRHYLLGKAFAVFWPPTRMKIIH